MSTTAFEAWFSKEMVTYRDDGDMIRHLLRTKGTLRTGFAAGFAAQATTARPPTGGYQPIGTDGSLLPPPRKP